MEVKERRMENNLITIGTGVLASGLWSFMKFILTAFFVDDTYQKVLTEQNAVILAITFWSVALINLGVHSYIGFSARAEGKRKRKGAYLVLTGIVAFVKSIAVVSEIVLLFRTDHGMIALLISLVIDTTATVFLVELMITSTAIRRIKKLRQQEAEQRES